MGCQSVPQRARLPRCGCPETADAENKIPDPHGGREGRPKSCRGASRRGGRSRTEKLDGADGGTNRTAEKQEWLTCRCDACIGRSLILNDQFFACTNLYTELSLVKWPCMNIWRSQMNCMCLSRGKE